MKAWRLAAGILLATLALWPALPVHAQAPLQLWVSDAYCSACANDGHTWEADAFNTVSAALRAAAPGATVHVRPGLYEEPVRIAQPVRLVADGPGAILAPHSAEVAVTVAANDVTVDGLEVAGGKQAGILVVGPDFQRLSILSISIRRNTVRGGLFGIAVNIDPTWNYGTLFASGIEISGNTVSGCTRALYVYNAQAEIVDNDVAGLQPEGIGIYSSQGSTSHIEANSVQVDAPNGRGVYILDNQGTVLDGNTLLGTSDVLTPTTAVTLDGFSDLVLSNNTVRGFYWGTNAYTGGTARVERNSFVDTAAWAMSFGTAITTTNVLVANNVISGSYWGLRLDDDGGYGLQASVQGNAFDNNVVGVQLASSVRAGQVALHGNALCGNLSAGLRNESVAPIDAAENWWGANSGPRPAGSGDGIEGVGDVTVSPWMRFSASATADGDSQATITASLASAHYRLAQQEMHFSTDQGAFVGSAGSTWTALTDADGEVRAVLALPQGQRARVSVSPPCGPSLTLTVLQPAPEVALPFRLPSLLPDRSN